LLAAPEVAVIVAVPFAIAVTSPADETVAIVASEDAHVTVAPVIVNPVWSLTVAMIVAVSPSDENDKVVSDSETVSATRVTVSESSLDALCPSPLVTCTVNVLVAAVVGVPEIVSPLSVSPAGNVPALTDHVYVPSPPVAVSVSL
jgi:hypothetical protein